MVGRQNFGLLRLPVYLERVKQGGIKCPCDPRLLNKSQSSAILDADNGFGQYGAKLAIEHAISLARKTGVGIVGVRNSNFFGTGAYFVQKAAQEGMIGLVMSNSFPKVSAYRGLSPVFGTNPLAFGAPQNNGDSFMFDMATSALAGSTVREHIDKKRPLPEGLAIDGSGNPITDPSLVADGTLLPAAGAKGYGLALVVEILAGVLAGAGISQGVSSMYKDVSSPGQNGHFMIVMDIGRFMELDVFYERLDGLVQLVKASKADGEVRIPGEIRWLNFRSSIKNGIELNQVTQKIVKKMCLQQDIEYPLAHHQ
jgi:LDH2 family malate/lactate/ureidoglycolate dehydrogenase